MQNSQTSGEKRSVSGRNRRIAGIGAILVVLAGVGAWISTSRNQKEPQTASLLRQAPDFALKDAAGKTHRLSDLRGNIVLLHFWATWCPPCLGEIPQWVELAGEFKGKPIKLLAVSLDESWEDAHKILPAEKVPDGLISVLDPKSETSDLYGSYAFPETYLINARGEIVTKWVGPQEWKSAEFLKLMDKLLEQSSQG